MALCSDKRSKMATSATAPSPPSPPHPLPSRNSRVRVSPVSSWIHLPWTPLLLLLSIISISISPSFCSPAKISYADHCSIIVPESAPSGTTRPLNPFSYFQIENGYFSGGEKLFSEDANSTFTIPKSLSFNVQELYQTQNPGTFGVKGRLLFRGGGIRVVRRNLTEDRSLLSRLRPPRIPRVFHKRGMVFFDLSGFWLESTGKLCMVGSGFSRSREGISPELSAVFKLNYPNYSTIANSMVRGTVESLDAVGSSNYFDTISLSAYSQKNYEYTLIPQAKKMSADMGLTEESLRLGSDHSICSLLRSFGNGGGFKLDYRSDCLKKNCGPFDGNIPSDGNIGYLPSFVSLGGVQCSEDGRLHSYIEFSNASYFAYNRRLVPELTLVSEGVWDHERNRLCLVACRVLNSRDSLAKASIGDCTIGFSLWFPAVLSIQNRRRVAGRIWSNLSATDSNYFETVSFWSFGNNMVTLPSVKYEYTEMELVKKSCIKNDVRNLKGRRYPDGKSISDFRFDAFLRNAEGKSVWGYATPLSIGETLYDNAFRVVKAPLPAPTVLDTNHSVWNVSYKISFSFINASSDLEGLRDISAEGIYNSETGSLCMIGCRHAGSSNGQKQTMGTGSMDCQILIRVQLASLNPESGEHLDGTITSMRNKSDSLYFKPLEIFSYTVYEAQAVESIWRMDIEITMVLISLTLSCVFIGLQLFYVKKHPEVLPSISLTMLVILTLGHMIPLVLNFEALFFMNRNKQNVLLWSGGWLEVNEVIVRVITMVAFLLQFRFLQLAWSARLADEGKKGVWAAERSALQLCLPLYFIGMVIAWFVHWRSYKAHMPRPGIIAGPHSSLWEDLISYAGLVLDGFLLPQVILNIFWNSKEKALTPAFYGGTTIVRALPHIYDAYRAQHYVPHFNSSYIYASPNGDFYSSAWDIIIPCEGLLFAILIYLQQRFGGCCILPPRFRRPGGYETVPVVSA